MQRLEVSGAVRPLQWPLGVKGLNKKHSHKKRTKDLWNTSREIQTQTKNGQHQTSKTHPQQRTSREKILWMPQDKKAMHRCRNRSNDLIHG
jgi:hypothetical protein